MCNAFYTPKNLNDESNFPKYGVNIRALEYLAKLCNDQLESKQKPHSIFKESSKTKSMFKEKQVKEVTNSEYKNLKGMTTLQGLDLLL